MHSKIASKHVYLIVQVKMPVSTVDLYHKAFDTARPQKNAHFANVRPHVVVVCIQGSLGIVKPISTACHPQLQLCTSEGQQRMRRALKVNRGSEALDS